MEYTNPRLKIVLC